MDEKTLVTLEFQKILERLASYANFSASADLARDLRPVSEFDEVVKRQARTTEARRLLALTRQGQSRAVSEGIPMELWVDSQRRTFGLEAEPSYEPTDEKAVEFTWESDIQLEAVNDGVNRSPGGGRLFASSSGTVAGRAVLSRHPELPRIRFLPDGSIAESSPQKLCLTGSDGFSIWLTQSRNRSSYELSNRSN